VSFDPRLTTHRDFVRFVVGDTNEAAHWVQDETIDALLAQFGYLETVAQIAESRAAQLIGSGSGANKRVKEGDEEVEKFDTPGFFRSLAERARAGNILAPNISTAVHEAFVVGEIDKLDLTELQPELN
jgi:hypothetical protein